MIAQASWLGDPRRAQLARRLLVVLMAAILTLAMQHALRPVPAVAAPVPVTPASPKVIEVAAGDTHACLLKPGGDVGCWGGQGSEAPPTGFGPFTSISAAGFGTCGLQQDRSIVCWRAQYDPRTVAGSFLSVSAGGDLFGCGLEVDQDVTCWDFNGPETALSHHDGPFVGVDAGSGHACAIKEDRSIACWGANDAGQAPAVVTGSFVSVSAGPSSTCGVDSGGRLSCWGDNSQGQSPTSVAGPFIMVSSVAERTCAVRSSGAAVCWGLPLGDTPSPVEVAGPFRLVAAGPGHVCAVRTNDLLSCWGADYLMPTPPTALEPDPFVQATETSPYRHGFGVWSTSAVTHSVQGTLPEGITLAPGSGGSYDTELVLSGTPRKRGTYSFTVVATNLFGASRLGVTLRVLPPPGFDANGDKIPDLPVGAPGEDVGSNPDAGEVTVLLGAADGTYGRAVAIGQETVGQRSERGDRFGAAIATGEVTGDDYIDLIIGAPGEDKGAGQVIVVHGSAKGLTGAKRTALRQGTGGAAGAAEAGDGFGTAVSVGSGLWIGAPGEDLGRASDAGVVTRFLSAPLRTAGSVQYQQGARKVPGAPEKGDRFGSALAGGGALIGAPGEDVGRVVDAGAVTWQLKYALSQDSAGVPGSAERGDQFGAAVATSGAQWDTDESGGWDRFYTIGVGAPGEDIGSRQDAGMVVVSADDLFPGWYEDEAEAVQQDTWTSSQRPEPGDRFGAALTISADGSRMVVGAPGEDVNSVTDGGALSVLSLSGWCDDGCNAGVDDGATLDQNTSGVPGSVSTGRQFGATLAERPGTAGGYVVGVPGTSVGGKVGAGAVVIMPARGTAQELHQDSPGVPGSAEAGDRFAIIPGP